MGENGEAVEGGSVILWPLGQRITNYEFEILNYELVAPCAINNEE